MDTRKLLICASGALAECGEGVRFEAEVRGQKLPAFAVRYGGKVRAFINRCAHVPVELDWEPGRFFDLTGHYVICAVHGAHYSPVDGRCTLGPCRGASLVPLPVEEVDGAIYLIRGPSG